MEPSDNITSSDAGLGGAEIRRREALRETYLGTPPARVPPSREELPSPISRDLSPLRPSPTVSENVPPPVPVPDPHAWVETAWVEADRETPMRVWYVENGAYSGYYAMDRTITSATRRTLRAREVSELFVRRNIERALTVPRSLARSIVAKLRHAARTHKLPSADEWSDWLGHCSYTLNTEYRCQSCAALCKTFNKNSGWVDGAEHDGLAFCRLVGRKCGEGDMIAP